MLTECQECGILFKTDNPKRKACYSCSVGLEFIVRFPEVMEPPESKAAKKR